MSEIKYLHFNNEEANKTLSKRMKRKRQSRTVAVRVLSKEQLTDLANNFLTREFGSVVMDVGVTYLNPEDKVYNKAVGRSEAASKLTTSILEVVSVMKSATHTTVKLKELDGIELYLKLNRLTGLVSVFGTMK